VFIYVKQNQFLQQVFPLSFTTAKKKKEKEKSDGDEGKFVREKKIRREKK
jgi:hypothetical protein